MNANEWITAVTTGYRLEKHEAMQLWEKPCEDLSAAADGVRRHFFGNGFELCAILNAKSGSCGEDCKFCAQSCRYPTPSESYSLVPVNVALEDAMSKEKAGISRYSLVTSGRKLNGAEVASAAEIDRTLKKSLKMSLCASHGLLRYEDLKRLKEAGVTRYHNNLETSRRYFPEVCSTHTYEDKLRTLEEAREAGLKLCSGGIIGLGENREDRVDLALELRDLAVDSVPINILQPIAGTPFADRERLTYDEIAKTVAIFRLLLPKTVIRLAGGRNALFDAGRRLFLGGANAAISGDMLTTAGRAVTSDAEMVRELGYEAKKL